MLRVSHPCLLAFHCFRRALVSLVVEKRSGRNRTIGYLMQIFKLNSLAADSDRTGQRWQEFLRAATLSMGLYRLKAGQADEQQPHTEDEVYLVMSGRASFQASEQNVLVAPGYVIFVERSVEHRFVDITEDLTLLVFFAPPEGSLKGEVS